MACTDIMSTYIKKLSHPIKEIRERSLQLLVAKLRLGWELEDELACTRDLLDALLAWFLVQQPALQEEALQLLLTTIKTKAGTYISREIGIKKMLTTLTKIKSKIEPKAMDTYYDVMETLRFLNTVESSDDVTVPPLTLNSLGNSESDETTSGVYYVGYNSQASKETSISNGDSDMDKCNVPQLNDGIKVLLFPWVELCTSDVKTMGLVEDALRLLKSTRRCCRFICDVFLQDFPAEIFLNRPAMIKSLLTIADGVASGRPSDALHVLLCVTRALRIRLLQLSSLDLVHEPDKITTQHKESTEDINSELENMARDVLSAMSCENDALVALKQLPAPLYALDTLHAVLTIMARSITVIDPVEKTEVLDMKELNICLSLVENLIELLLDCVSETFWSSEHSSKTHRDIAHKSCMVMRLLGDLLTKYRKSFLCDTNRSLHLVAWLRLLPCAERLLDWSKNSALPPTSIAIALQSAQLDPALGLLYPELSERISKVLQEPQIAKDQEYKNKYRELKKICSSMENAASFIKNKNSCKSSKKVLDCIRKSLPVLELHLSEAYLNEVSEILLKRTKEFSMDDHDWASARNIALSLMAHNIEWVQVKFYRMIAEMVRCVLVGDEANQVDNEKCLNLLFDVGVLTEICCHGLCSKTKEVESCASDMMLYLLRGRLVLSEGCWWRLLACLLPVLSLLHVYAAHDTQLGQAICKSLESDIAECMGVSRTEITFGLVRLLFVRCSSVQLDAAHALCRFLDNEKYLPPKESLRPDVLMSALSRVEPQDFNIDYSCSPSKLTPTTGLTQILDVLKQDIILDEQDEYSSKYYVTPALEPSLRRSTLQQLSVIMRQQDMHETFLQCDGLRVIVAILRMSMTVDDYLAFPECAISCVSVLNSICFGSRHDLAKLPDLPLLLIRVILVFPANDSAVLMSAQILALVAWSGFVMQELDATRHRVPALPLSVTQRTTLPFIISSYWNTSPNTQHSSVEWLLSDEDVRAAIRVQWWCACEGGNRVIRGAPPPPAPLSLRPTSRDLASLRAACPSYSCTRALLDLENATSHRQVIEALCLLESYTHLVPMSSVSCKELGSLPWQHTRRFLCAPPASSRDTTLLISLLKFIHTYTNLVPNEDASMLWIKKSFIGCDASVISLLSRDQLYLEQTPQENIEVTQLHIHIVRVLLKCIVELDHYDDYNSHKMESLIKILLACLQKLDLKNFHMLGYLNELVRCIRYALNSKYSKLSEDTLVQCLCVMTATLAGCAAGGGRKGQACRLDALLALLALLKQAHEEGIPVQRWSEAWTGDAVRAVVKCSGGATVELRASALHVMAALAHYAQLMPHLLQAIPTESLSQYAARIFSESRESNVVRSAAAALLTALAARATPHTDVLECDILEQLKDNDFIENCLDVLVRFFDEKKIRQNIEPNVPCSVLERRSEFEVRSQKCGDVHISPSLVGLRGRPPPTATLVMAVADLLYNVSAFPRCPVQAWNDRGLYRLLFRCASWSRGSVSENHKVRHSSCRALTAAARRKCVRASLATTHDCLLNLLTTLKPLDTDVIDLDCLNARAQALLLVATLLPEKSASDILWRALRESRTPAFFHTLLQCLESDEQELQDAAIYCLTQLSQSTNKKHIDKTKDQSRVEFYDALKSPFRPELLSGRGSGDRMETDCQPEYMAEELCKVLIELYQKLAVETKILTNQDERWHRVCSCLSSVMSISPRSRWYGVHRALPQALLLTLQGVRDRLALQGSADVIRSAAQNPTIRALYWLLTLIDCHMIDCVPAKDNFAEDGIALSLVRLWPWCMLTPDLREAIVHLLLTFSNDCPKAWGAMSTCVGGRSLVNEVCALAVKEASHQSRPRPDTMLVTCLRTLTHLVPHHHCRAIIIKSEIITSMYKSRIHERSAGGVAEGGGGAMWARLVEAAARHADGAGALLALRPLHAPPSLRARLMPAIAHLARHRRAAVLQATDLLELLSGTLLAGDTAEIVSAARAVWALAANNHKAKLLLRSAGVAAAVQSALQRMQRLPDDAATQRATQLLLYTNSILQAT